MLQVMKLKTDKDFNVPRFIISLTIMTAAAVIGSYFASGAGERWFFLTRAGFKNLLIFDLAVLLVIFLSGFLPRGSIIALMALAVKGFRLSAAATICIRLYGTRGYFFSIPAFLGGLLSVTGITLLSMRAIDLSVEKRYNNIKADRSFFAALFICAALCAAGAAVSSVSFN